MQKLVTRRRGNRDNHKRRGHVCGFEAELKCRRLCRLMWVRRFLNQMDELEGIWNRVKRSFARMDSISIRNGASKWAGESPTKTGNGWDTQVLPGMGRPESNYGYPGMCHFYLGSTGSSPDICSLMPMLMSVSKMRS